MNTTLTFTCHDTHATKALAHAIGERLRGGEAIEFKSDLGGGKTTFTKGLAHGMGVKTVVQSPTFTISQVHQGVRGLELHHFDFYRLDDPGIMKAELAESLQQPNAVVALEWGDIVHDILPAHRMTIEFRTNADDSRVITVHCPEQYEAVMRALLHYHAKKSKS